MSNAPSSEEIELAVEPGSVVRHRAAYGQGYGYIRVDSVRRGRLVGRAYNQSGIHTGTAHICVEHAMPITPREEKMLYLSGLLHS